MSAARVAADPGLERTLALTQAMIEAAGQGRWDRVGELESERAALLPASAADVVGADSDVADLARALERLVALNRELLALASAERDGRRERLARVTAGQRADAAYRDSAA